MNDQIKSYRALLVMAQMEIFVPFDDAMATAKATFDVQFEAALAQLPEWAKDRFTKWTDLDPAHLAFIDRQDWVAIRNEFARKAKKIGLSAATDIAISCKVDGVMLSCKAHGRA